jgi:methionyl-tRNA formyltransferase
MKHSILLSNNNRSKAYLQNLVKNGFTPCQAIVLCAGNALRPENTNNDLLRRGQWIKPLIRGSRDAGIYFNENEHVLDTLDAAGIDSIVMNTMDVNSDNVINAVREVEGDYVVYSGPGGAILRKRVMAQGKEFIHVHPGWLPAYRGSTTLYYSLLVDKTVSCSVFLMRGKIDAGPLLYRKTFRIVDTNVDFDYVLDPAIRASTLLDFFANADEYLDHQAGQSGAQGNTFYIIHPVLKHLAILSIKGEDRGSGLPRRVNGEESFSV